MHFTHGHSQAACWPRRPDDVAPDQPARTVPTLSVCCSTLIQTETANEPKLDNGGCVPPKGRILMSGESLLIILAVGLVAGWLAGQIVQGTGFGIIGDLVIGILGAFIGGWLLPRLGIHLGTGM